MRFRRLNKNLLGAAISLLAASQSGTLMAWEEPSQSVTYKDIAIDENVGIDYRRLESERFVFLEQIRETGFFYPQSAFANPLKANGAPGLVIFDYDNDGDQDIYVTNGPGRANSLYANQMVETGELTFVDKAAEAGLLETERDSSGVCYGDIDNDGDADLVVLSSAEGNSLYENMGNGQFVNIDNKAQFGGVDLYSTSCSMGDVNGDGLLDIVIANTYDNWDDFGPIVSFEEQFRNQDNQLFINQGDNRFVDTSVEAGITNFQGISWATAMVDYDQDGDVDLFFADDQGAKPGVIRGGLDFGYVRVYNNDGTGVFTDVTADVGTNRFGAWMALTFADYNNDGHLDFFASNIGDYMARFMEDKNLVPFPIIPGDWNSGWFLGNEEATFTFPNVGELKATPFGWGAISIDYDNDADTDIVYHGGIDMGSFADGANPGAMLNNDGNANFDLDVEALAGSTDHGRREVMGVASSDFNNDGFPDMVTVSAVNWDSPMPLGEYLTRPFGGPFDQYATRWQTFFPNDPNNFFAGFTWSGFNGNQGTVSLEVSDQVNNNNWVKVKLMGTVGMVEGGSVNRDGIGAIMRFTPRNSDQTAMVPVVSGSSYASQSDMTTIFGLGSESRKGTIDVTWPGGVKNRLVNVRRGTTVLFPEIPCSYDTDMPFDEYQVCVRKSLRTLKSDGVISSGEAGRLFASAKKAYLESR